ncbi:hypothetical protein FHU30_003957 [Actinomadura rupiterrae]|nr:hypothetical protein [Actinomadura rupiterrae]
MMAELRRGTYNALALPNIDRGMRDPRDLEDLIDLVEHYGVLVVGMTGYLDLTTDAGIAMARNEVNQRNLESRNLSRRISTGKRRAALKGRNSGGANRLFGWEADKKRLREDEVIHLREGRPRLVAGVKPRTLAREWNARQIPSATGKVTGRQWTARIVEQIFTNPRLCGYKTYLGEVLRDRDGNPVRGEWEAPFTVDEFEEVSAVLKHYPRTNPRDGRGHPYKYLLSPFIRCGRCTSKMRGGSRPGPKGTKVAVYACRSTSDGGCGGCSRTAAKVDEYITALVIAEHKRRQFVKLGDLPPWPNEQALKDVQSQIKEAQDAYEARQISGSRFFPMLERLESEERALRADKKRHEAERAQRSEAILDLEAKWEDPDFTLDQRQAAIAQSLTAVVIHPAKPGQRFDPDLIDPVWREEE